MQVIHRTNDYSQPYEIVTLIKLRISKTNGLSLIEKDGKQYMTGGIIVPIHEATIKTLNTLTNKEQWNWLCVCKMRIKSSFVEWLFDNNYSADEIEELTKE